jgi:hypothetical protein
MLYSSKSLVTFLLKASLCAYELEFTWKLNINYFIEDHVKNPGSEIRNKITTKLAGYYLNKDAYHSCYYSKTKLSK